MIKCASVFSDNMVMQREKNVLIWGECEGVESIIVSVEEKNVSVCADINGGSWKAVIPPQSACESCTVTVRSDNGECISFCNVAFGEVWLCGGQSNMELEIRNAKDGKQTLSSLTPECNVRFYYTPKQTMVDAELLEAEKHTGWSTASEQNAQAWSAVGLHFGLKLAKELGVVVGLIGCNWGGTLASCWMSREKLAEDKQTAVFVEEYDEAVSGKTTEQCLAEYKDFQEYDRQWNERCSAYYSEHPDTHIGWDELQEAIGKNMWPGPMGPKNPTRPYGLYEAMISRVCPYTLKGFMYYQGESDEGRPQLYYKLLTKLIEQWRGDWGDFELPFLIVQLPMFKYAHEEDNKRWAFIREAQDKAFRTVKNTGLAVILDKGEFDNIHPTDKQPVGERLAMQAEELFYGVKVNAFGPMYKSYECKDGSIELSFDNAEDGFEVSGEVTGFEIAGSDKKFVPADVKISGSKIFVSSESVRKPAYVRYCFVNYGDVTVFGKNGIPLAPFRTSSDDV